MMLGLHSRQVKFNHGEMSEQSFVRMLMECWIWWKPYRMDHSEGKTRDVYEVEGY